MKKFLVGGAVLILVIVLVSIFRAPLITGLAEIDIPFVEKEPDIPAMLKKAKGVYNKEDFLQKRAEYFGLLRGVKEDEPVDIRLRQDALQKMKEQEEANFRLPLESEKRNLLLASWSAIGPNPIPNGSFPWSGRTISIAVHPTNPNIVYVGAAQGGLYRSTDGGTNWTPLMDNALSLAIGAIAVSPSQPETIYVGTGEHNFSLDSFFGVGVYRIDNASTTATLTGPLNQDGGGNDIFTGRGISRILVHPTNPDIIFVSTTSGLGGISGTSSVFPSRGIYRSTNATTGNPTFTKLTGLASNINASVRDIALDPGNSNILVAALVAGAGTGGLYRSTDILSSNPTFTQTQIFNSSSTSELTAEFAAIHPQGDADATFYAATGNLGGRVLRSTDGGASWTQQIDNNFCTPQCFYDIAVAVDPTDPNRVYLGGAPTLPFGISTTAGTAFTNSSGGLHVDSHVIAVAPSNNQIIYFGSDGGIYKSTNAGSNWTSLNNTQYFATQFMSIAVHPTDANFTIGGTQDNGTNFYSPTSTWARVDGGDGGYTLIDQNAADNTNVRMYHTYFNSISSPLVGYATRGTTTSGWSFRGCSGTAANGINCNDTAILFYAPLEQGPGSPNTVYYGSDRLYRSDDTGLTHTVVSQAPINSGVPLSSIGISPQNDNVRIVGLANGGLFGTTTGASTLTDLDPTNSVPNSFIARSVIDPNNPNVAYVSLSGFGVNNVFKTTNFNSSPPTWTPAVGTGPNTIPQVPVSGFVVDPQNSNNIYAGTDIGVYVSTDAGQNWSPLGTGLPRVAVFDMALTNGTPRKLRVATHGKGMYEISLDAQQKTAFDYDGDNKTDISIFRPSVGQWWIQRSSTSITSVDTFGTSSDTLVPADYTGDGKTDIAFWRPSTGEWFVLRSEDSSFFSFPFGASTDIPAPGDFDGDGRDDPAIFRPSTGTWFILASTQGTRIEQFGASGDVPVVGDYDGDGQADKAIYRVGSGQWWLDRSSAGLIVANFGTSTDRTVQGDYTGDGKTDVAFWRPSTGEWFVLRSEDSSFFSFPFGAGTDAPVPGDYDGDGRTDAGVYRPVGNTWFINASQSGQIIQSFGAAGDIPTPNVFVR
ncbi:MAG: VCBS repeat-containing protein [Pyrinomonadaceae bacterium]